MIFLSKGLTVENLIKDQLTNIISFQKYNSKYQVVTHGMV